MWRYVDYDGDGDHDLIVGIGDWTDYGWDHAYDNHGTLAQRTTARLRLSDRERRHRRRRRITPKTPRRLKAGGGDIDVYGWPSPNFADFDGDGDLDLLCGEFLDGFTYFENIGSREAARLCGRRRLQ